MKHALHRPFRYAFAATLVILLNCQLAKANDVVPVPTEVVPKKIEGSKPRNVVFILSDDHRYDAMSFMGHQFAETPHMDAMARSGVHMKNAFVTTSLCSPSRASILTTRFGIESSTTSDWFQKALSSFRSICKRLVTKPDTSANGIWAVIMTTQDRDSITG